MKRVLLLLFCSFFYLSAQNVAVVIFAEGPNATGDLTTDESTIVHTSEMTDKCAPMCYKITDDIRTYIQDFDARTGVTYCSANKLGLSEVAPFSVNTFNPFCVANTTVSVSKNELVTDKNATDTFASKTQIQYVEPQGYLPFARFISAMMTLDPEIIDFEQTNSSGSLKLKGGYTLKGIDVNYEGNDEAKDNLTGITSSIADKFNKANLAYYSNLFANMSVVYGYVQNLLFVFVGMFFIGQIGYSKANQLLEKQGGNLNGGGDSQWLSRFMTPVLAVGFFFAPIPEDAGMNATIVQKGIRYMTQQSNIIADHASAIGVNTYVQKLYATVGASNTATEVNARLAIKQAEALMPIYNEVLIENCYKRYPSTASFLRLTEEQKIRLQSIDQNKYRDNKQDDISIGACQLMEYRLRTQYEIWLENKKLVKGIEKVYSGGNSENIQNFLAKVNNSLQQRQEQLGWANAIIIPAASILVESLGIVQDNVAITTADKSDITLAAALIDLTSDKVAQKNVEESSANRRAVGNDLNSNADNAKIGNMIGNFAFFMLPGAQGMYNSLVNGKDGKTSYKEEARAIATKLNSGLSADEQSRLSAFDASKDEDMLVVTATLYQWMLEKAPIVFSVIAGVIAFIGYVVELAKFFYISPFVVAFALTTKKTHKIVDFMVTGLTVFFKPILLVIFIFFAIFIHTLVQDIFLHYTMEQFDVLKGIVESSSQDGTDKGIISGAVIDLVKVMLQIFGSIGAAYIMWKLILSGPTWAMKMVGVDSAQNDVVSEALSQRMDRSFRM